MAIQYVGYKNFISSSATFSVSLTALTGGIASSAAAGDLVIAVFVSPAGSDYNLSMATTGYTKVADLFASTIVDTNLGVFYKVMAATPNTTAVFNNPTGSVAYGLAYVLRGVDGTTPLDATTTTATGIGSTLPDPPSITTVTSGAMVVAVGGGFGLGQGSLTAPSGYSNQAADGNRIAVASKIVSSPAAEDPAAWTGPVTGSNYSWAAATLAIRPSVVAASGQAKVWNGSTWVAKPVKVWNGSAWVTKPVKRWNGTAWVTTTY